jgi:hypothetical protein
VAFSGEQRCESNRYTAIVAGKGTSGIGLVEIYNLR